MALSAGIHGRSRPSQKSAAKYFYQVANQAVGTSRVTEIMAKRLKKIWGHMVWQNTGKHIKQFIKNVNAPLEHLFNNHEYCKSEWCNALKSKEGGKPYKHLDDFCTWSTTEEEKIPRYCGRHQKYGSNFFTPKYAPIQHPNQRSPQPKSSLYHPQAGIIPRKQIFPHPICCIATANL